MKSVPSSAPLQTKASKNRHAGAAQQLLMALCEGHWRRLLLGIALACATALMGALLLGISGWFITGTAIAGLSATTAIAFDVFTPSASIRLLALGRTASRYGERVLSHSAALQALVGVRERLFRAFSKNHAQGTSSQQWRLQPARVLLRLTRDLNAAESLYLRLMLPSCAAIFTTAGISLWLGLQAWWLGLASLLWFFGWGFGLVFWLVHATTQLTLNQSRLSEQMRKQALDVVGGQTELVMAGLQNTWHRQLLQKEAQVAKLDAQLQKRDAMAAAAWQALHSATMVAALGTAAWLVLERGVGVATGAFLVLMAMAGMEPFAALRRGALEWANTLLAARRLQAPLQSSATSADGNTLHLPAPTPGLAVQLRHVSVQATQRRERLRDCSLDIARGERVAIVGASGSGKSTLLGLIAGEVAATSGSVRALPNIALPQQASLFNDTVRANIDLQQRQMHDTTLWAALESVDLKEVIAARAAGLDERLGEGGLGLSKGQARRLALARLFALPHDFWLLDEPTDGLDSDTAADVLERLAYSLHNKTAVIATHMRREAQLADRLLVIEGGRITQQVVRDTPAFEHVLRGLRDG